MAKKAISIRLDEELLRKLRVIAASEARSINGQVLVIMKQKVEQYEAKHGKIEVNESLGL